MNHIDIEYRWQGYFGTYTKRNYRFWKSSRFL